MDQTIVVVVAINSILSKNVDKRNRNVMFFDTIKEKGIVPMMETLNMIHKVEVRELLPSSETQNINNRSTL